MKISTPIRIQGQGIWIPDGRVHLQPLVDQGKLSQEDFDTHAYVSLHQDEHKTSRSDAAYAAAKQAMVEAKNPNIGISLFSTSTGKDRKAWSQSSDLTRRIEQPKAQFLDVYQGCSGVLAASEVALSKLMMDSSMPSALVAGADFFAGDKWDNDFLSYYGDGAGAWVFGKEEGPFQILSINGAYDADLNDMIYTQDETFNIKDSKRKFLEKHGSEFVYRSFEACSDKVLSATLKEADLQAMDISYLVMPNFGKELLEKILVAFDMPLSKTSWEFGREAGHMASVDPIINLYMARKLGRIKSGDHVLIVVHGAGISVMQMLIRV
jgi:3-oxoacyl-[acyl-carrier-protein] synthase-3